ncbi:hypothetical protein NC653_013081 [Populus alba x Populus x berolinensis]|uniref:TIR domain-containing protein n=1 Tax=Populus alba x Populus x berolinensis TaxID=444605 RepID=A0AAD6QTX4_9ROSI|nr:hypothetical protein NC653_013081 [Populus alba x Populus x berolinensis]
MESEIVKWERTPDMEIQKILRMSCDGIDSDEKSIFLDVACFFSKGNKDRRARYMKIHDLLQQLAQDIVRQECNMSDPPKRIRLWIPEDVLHVLTYHQDIHLDLHQQSPRTLTSVNFCIMASSSSAVAPLWKYDVFLSFRGADVRHNFLRHLDDALDQNEIETFIDYKLGAGEEISRILLEKIEQSNVSIVIFSKNYADSPWCLEELEKILECRKTLQQIVIPVFYHVDPTHVRELSNSYGNALAAHQKKFSSDKRSAGKRLVVVREGISTPNAPYLRLQEQCTGIVLGRLLGGENSGGASSHAPPSLAVRGFTRRRKKNTATGGAGSTSSHHPFVAGGVFFSASDRQMGLLCSSSPLLQVAASDWEAAGGCGSVTVGSIRSEEETLDGGLSVTPGDGVETMAEREGMTLWASLRLTEASSSGVGGKVSGGSVCRPKGKMTERWGLRCGGRARDRRGGRR